MSTMLTAQSGGGEERAEFYVGCGRGDWRHLGGALLMVTPVPRTPAHAVKWSFGHSTAFNGGG